MRELEAHELESVSGGGFFQDLWDWAKGEVGTIVTAVANFISPPAACSPGTVTTSIKTTGPTVTFDAKTSTFTAAGGGSSVSCGPAASPPAPPPATGGAGAASFGGQRMIHL